MSALGRLARAAAGLAAGWLLVSCSVVEQGAGVLADAGQISESDKQAIVKTSSAARSTFSDITEEEEYYIGRGVAALVLAQYSVYRNDALTRYVNELGQSVAVFSNRPETYAGFHFAVLDSDEVNALAAPGGLIFVTRGLLRRCQNEEMLASVLAHEVGHVAAKHGLQSIKKSRLIDAFEVIGQTAAERYGPAQLSQLTTIFESALGDVVDTLIIRGYDRKYEYEADDLAVKCLASAGFSAQGLPDFLKTMVNVGASEQGKGWFKTHPSAAQRLEKVSAAVASAGAAAKVPPARTQRFQQNTKGV
jgi:beta-barrel assembly-enhancing protease